MKRGYTLVEVSLVIVITSILFIAFIATVGTQLSLQRFNDSSNNFAEFLRTVYSSVTAVQNNGDGNSRQSIYGKLVTFGEKGSGRTIHTYDVIGDAAIGDQISSGLGVLQALESVNVNIFNVNKEIINQSSYDLTNGAWLEFIPAEEVTDSEYFTGALLIVRSPSSGAIVTMYRKAPINIQTAPGDQKTDVNNPLRRAIEQSHSPYDPNSNNAFKTVEVNFCVASDDRSNPKVRRNIRLARNASGSSGVQIIPQDSGDNKCEN